MSIIIFLDGVIRNETKTPIFEGISLYRALNADATVVFAVSDEEEATKWCLQHKFQDVDGYIDDSKVKTKEDKNFAKIEHIRSAGTVFFVVTADVDLAKKCLEHGIRTLLFIHPIYMSHKFRPDSRTGVKSWSEIESELDKQIEMLAEDKRI